MRIFHFTENPYPLAWDKSGESLRVTLPNQHFDPAIGNVAINQYLDQWALADDLGMDIMINEHHSTATSLTVNSMLPLSIMARETKRAKLLSLGVPIGLRADPVAAAEEIAWVDVVSGGRLEVGLVKGFATEVAPANGNPAITDERFNEAEALILKTLTTHDGPFSWEGEHFQYRQVNIWPRPIQTPYPPLWRTGHGVFSAIGAADADRNLAGGYFAAATKQGFEAYRKRFVELGRPAPGPERLGYLVFVAVASSEDVAEKRMRTLLGDYVHRGVVSPQFNNPPGFTHFKGAAAALGKKPVPAGPRTIPDRDGTPLVVATAPREDLVRAGLVFAGTPDQVFEQMCDFYDYVGGFGTMVAQMQGGALSHEDVTDSMRLMSTEVMPRLEQFTQGRELSLR
jgi:alkanesulfonate monooxygenase SsuD/methylene tetrahydromethanopterin reductase-like flavin-dependent oxidoreductase (luciferase family)